MKTDWGCSGKLVIEPGESHIEAHAFSVDYTVRAVKVSVVVENAGSNGLKWDAIRFYDIENPTKGR